MKIRDGEFVEFEALSLGRRGGGVRMEADGRTKVLRYLIRVRTSKRRKFEYLASQAIRSYSVEPCRPRS